MIKLYIPKTIMHWKCNHDLKIKKLLVNMNENKNFYKIQNFHKIDAIKTMFILIIAIIKIYSKLQTIEINFRKFKIKQDYVKIIWLLEGHVD